MFRHMVREENCEILDLIVEGHIEVGSGMDKKKMSWLSGIRIGSWW